MFNFRAIEGSYLGKRIDLLDSKKVAIEVK